MKKDTKTRVAIVTKAFALSNNDYCAPPLIDYVRSISDRVELDIHAIDYPFEQRRFSLFGARIFAYGARRLTRFAAHRRLKVCLRQEHKRAPYDLIHAVWADHPAKLAAGLAQELNIPLITSLYAGEAVTLPQIGYGSLRHDKRRRSLTSLLSASAAVTAGSLSLAEHTKLLCGRAVEAIPLGYDPTRFGAAGPSEDLGPGRHIVTAASFGAVKGIDLILEALQRVAQDHPRLLTGVTWHVIGPDPLDRVLRQAVEQQVGALPVVLHEARPHWEMPQFYRGADLALVGSWFESQCFAAIEAAAVGTPVLGTQVGILPTMASPDWLCPPGSAAALKDLIIHILSTPENWEAEARHQQAWLAKNATVDVARERFMKLYGRVVVESASA